MFLTGFVAAFRLQTLVVHGIGVSGKFYNSDFCLVAFCMHRADRLYLLINVRLKMKTCIKNKIIICCGVVGLFWGPAIFAENTLNITNQLPFNRLICGSEPALFGCNNNTFPDTGTLTLTLNNKGGIIYITVLGGGRENNDIVAFRYRITPQGINGNCIPSPKYNSQVSCDWEVGTSTLFIKTK